MPMGTWTPRALRSRYNNKSGNVDAAKSKAFRRCKLRSDRFIHQSASALASPALASQYSKYCADTASGTGFRKG